MATKTKTADWTTLGSDQWPANNGRAVEAAELALFIDNDGTLYRNGVMYAVANLVKRYAAGTYDEREAPKLWLYIVDRGAVAYEHAHGNRGVKTAAQSLFSLPVRRAVAVDMARCYGEMIRDGQFDAYIPKKYGGEGRKP